jgi:hypothetical protein
MQAKDPTKIWKIKATRTRHARSAELADGEKLKERRPQLEAGGEKPIHLLRQAGFFLVKLLVLGLSWLNQQEA